MTTAGTALMAGSRLDAATATLPRLTSLTKNAQPITPREHASRIAKLQSLMQERKIGALLVEAGSSLEYYTGIRWWRSERTTAAVIPARGETIIVTPFFEESSIRETLKIAGDVRTWQEDESPFELIAAGLRDRATPEGPLAMSIEQPI